VTIQTIIIEEILGSNVGGAAPTVMSERVFEMPSCRPAWVVFLFNYLYLDFEMA